MYFSSFNRRAATRVTSVVLAVAMLCASAPAFADDAVPTPTASGIVNSDTATPAPDAAAPAPDTATPAPDAATPVPDTATPVPDTATPAPGTATPAPDATPTAAATPAAGTTPAASPAASLSPLPLGSAPVDDFDGFTLEELMQASGGIMTLDAGDSTAHTNDDLKNIIQGTLTALSLSPSYLAAFTAATGIPPSGDHTFTWFDTGSLPNCSDPWNGTTTRVTKDATDDLYHIKTAEDLAWVVENFNVAPLKSTSPKAVLDNDINLNGAEYYWKPGYWNLNQSLDGNNHTIYNLCVTSPGDKSRTGFMAVMDNNAVINNLTFNTGYINNPAIGTGARTGIIAFVGSGSNACFTNLHAVNMVYTSRTESVGSLFGRMAGGSIENCSAKDCTTIGTDHIGSLSSALVNTKEISYCYSTGCVVISTGSHSGGLFSCVGGTTIHDCFTDVHVYGSDKTGVFTGAANSENSSKSRTVTFTNCAASGFVDGQKRIGGFIGAVENSSTQAAFTNCYSSAMVGVELGAAGTQQGGFIGCIEDTVVNAKFTNCYAAGEVGSVNTSVASGTTTQPENCGGFLGFLNETYDVNASFSECYYDKQTTAMREWGVGNPGKKTNVTGITGLLTTTTAKAGTGMVDQPIPGFDPDRAQHLPELAAFATPAIKTESNPGWASTEMADTAKAFSLSSTSTMLLDTWEHGLDVDTGTMTATIDSLTYCTVRDLTSSFPLTSNGSAAMQWQRMATADSKVPTKGKVTIAGTEYDVLDLKHEGGTWLCDELVPGIEWLLVSNTVGEQTVSRRVRVIPTAGVEAGPSVVITDKYDHADDVELYFSTGERLATDLTNITTGIYPDSDSVAGANALTAKQHTLMDNLRTPSFNINAAFDGTGNATNDLYRGATAATLGSSADNYMSNGADNAKNSKLYTYFYPVASINETTGEITPGALLDVQPGNTLGQQFNGYVPFDNSNIRYLATYMWVLQDGRVLTDSKLLRRAEVPFTETVNLYRDSIDDANLYGDGGYLYAGALLSDRSSFETNTSVAAAETNDAQLGFEEKSTAAWKLKSEYDKMTQLKLTFFIGEGETYSATIDNPVEGSIISVPYTVYRVVYRNNGYYTINNTVTTRKYTLHHDTTNDVWYLDFDKQNEASAWPDVVFNDTEMDYQVDVVVSSGNVEVPLTGTKTLTGLPSFADDAFTFALTEDAANDKTGYFGFTGNASLKANGTITFDTLTFRKAGTYRFTASETGTAPTNYTYDTKPVLITVTVTADGAVNLKASVTYAKTGGGNTLSFANVYSAPVPTATVIPGPTTSPTSHPEPTDAPATPPPSTASPRPAATPVPATTPPPAARIPRTGDNSPFALFVILCSGSALTYLVLRRKRR